MPGNDNWRVMCCGVPLVLVMAAFSLGALLTLILPALQTGNGRANAPTPAPRELPPIHIMDRQFDLTHLTAGRQIYLQHCAACHGASGQGQFPAAPPAISP